MDSDVVIGFGILLIIIGMCITFAPYPFTQKTYYTDYTGQRYVITVTGTAYGHPIGFLIDGIGFILLISGLWLRKEES